jgi:hypothetical protein
MPNTVSLTFIFSFEIVTCGGSVANFQLHYLCFPYTIKFAFEKFPILAEYTQLSIIRDNGGDGNHG